uniref:trypsin n=1 Tax=Scleropages formosus TaxID=113540 RepID=A0A8C9S919_SCLFO
MKPSVILQYLLLDVFLVAGQRLIQGRIVGGYVPAPHSIRYIVSIQSPSGRHFCGGSLVHRYWVLTAAHCNIGSEQMTIVAGDHSLNIYEGTEQYSKPQRLIPHPQYDKSTNDADIMLIKLKVPVILNRYVSVVALPRQGASLPEGRACWVSGWGHTSTGGGQLPSTLHTAKLPVISSLRCNGSESFNGNITKNMMCAGYSSGGKDACKGDSGGPLVCQGFVHGVVSWGNLCAKANFPGVYTAVSRFRRWIDRTIFGSYSNMRR